MCSSRFISGFRLSCWGLTEHGALGLAKPKARELPRFISKPVRHSFAEHNEITRVECGFGFTALAVKSYKQPKLFGCGINSDSQIGYHDTRRNQHLDILLCPAPICLELKSDGTNIIALSSGRAHLAVLTDNEGLFTLGSNCFGQCGRPIVEEEKYCGSRYIHNIDSVGGEQIGSVTCGQDHTLLLTESGKVYSCGFSGDGQTGLGTYDCVPCPSRVSGDIERETIVKLAGKSDCILALSTCGEVFGWGNNEYGQLDAVEQQVNFPQRLTKLKGLGKIIDIAAGGSFCMALNDCGDVFVWGYGILGAGPNVLKSNTPIPLPKTLFGCNEYQPDARVTEIYCGLSHLAAVNNYFNLYMWGRNRYGCLGIGHICDQYFPYKVAIGSQVVDVSCGVDHTMVLCKPY